MAATILLAEDDADIRGVLRLYLESEGYRVLETENGAQALEAARAHAPDLALVDVMMPEMNGYELTRALRGFTDIPVLILSAKSQANDKILGLNLGADDYIAKPFNPMEVTARVKAHLRRAARTQPAALTAGGLSLDAASLTVEKGGRAVALTPMEYKLLSVLMRAPGRIFTKGQPYEAAAGDYFEGDDNTMMVHISKLREKIEDDPRNPRRIVTVRGLGYKFEAK